MRAGGRLQSVRRWVRRIVLVTAGTAALGVLAVVVARTGLDPADKVASIVAAVAAVASLVWSIVIVRRPRGVPRVRHKWEQFARHLVLQLHDLANREDWEDERYAELEAEVEMEDRRRRGLLRRRPGLRRVSSLSVALEESDERLILLEGEPGSGKSIALRHVAQRMDGRAGNAYVDGMVIPIYVNLRAFRPEGNVDAGAVRRFVLDSLNPNNVRGVDDFLEQEFDRGVEDGTWLFLFDSFDEIPEILSSTDADVRVNRYAEAISTFLQTMSRCRGVIASREFRGPARLGWPRFRIVRLSEQRRRLLVSRALLDRSVEEALVTGLAAANADLRELADTPLFLGMLCAYLREGGSFPDSSHTVFARYVENRLERDANRLHERFGVSSAEVRRVAEEVAFCMASVPGMGLEADREQLGPELSRSAPDLPEATIRAAMDGLQYTKLARSATGERLTFAHRRLQEYFATCVALRQPDRVPPRQLLTDQNWREAAVTILQTQSRGVVQPLVDEAMDLLKTAQPGPEPVGGGFRWQEGHLHLLHLLAAGLGARPHWLTVDSRLYIGQLLRQAWDGGRRHDRRWGLEVVTLADESNRLELLQAGFASWSPLLQGEAYRQTGRLTSLPDALASSVRKGLVSQLQEGDLRRRRAGARAQIQRLDEPASMLTALGLLLALRVVDAGLAVVGGAALLQWSSDAAVTRGVLAAGFVAATVASLPLLLTARHVSLSVASLRRRRIRGLLSAAARTLGRRPQGAESYFGFAIGWRFLLAVAGTVIVARAEAGAGATALALVLLLLPVLWTPFAVEAIGSTRQLRGTHLPFLPFLAVKRAVVSAWRYRDLQDLDEGIEGIEAGIGGVLLAAGCFVNFSVVVVLGGVASFAGGFLILLVLHGAVWLVTLGHVNVLERVLAEREQAESAEGDGDGETSADFHLTPTWTAVLVGLAVLVVLVVFGVLGRAAVLHWRDARVAKRARRAVGTGRQPLGVEQLVEVVSSARGDQDLQEIVIALRRQGSLRGCPDAVRFLSDLAATAERARNGRFVLPAENSGAHLRHWLPSSQRARPGRSRRRLVRSMSSATVDEISNLVREAEIRN